MKLNKKKVLVVSLAISLVAILSFGTIAWFNAADEVTNTFKIADSDDTDTTPDFSVDVFETNDPENDGITYENILPGKVMAKDPTVKNTGMYSMYTRVTVTLSDATTWLNAMREYGLATDNLILEELVDIDTTNWKRYTGASVDVEKDTISYVYYYNSVVAPEGTTTPVFTEVTIPTELQQKDMDFGTDLIFTIGVKAEAIQSENIVPAESSLTQNDAFKAFTTAGWNELGTYPQQ